LLPNGDAWMTSYRNEGFAPSLVDALHAVKSAGAAPAARALPDSV
jgi:hypothetical protein